MQIRTGVPVTKMRRGRKRGSGVNMFLIKKLGIDDCLWNIPRKKFLSLKHSAYMLGVKLKTRKLPSGLYAIWRLN